MKRMLTLSLTVLALAAVHAETPHKARPEALQRWRDGRFGMFIHWGPVSLTEKEISWSRANSNRQCPNNGPTPVAVYDNLYKKFAPVKFDAQEWVGIAKAAGMKYLVLTAKHCDGFLLWDSKVDDYNIMHTPFKRDVCAELAQAARAAGLGIGWYYSPMDWRDPDCRNAKNAEFVQRMQAELTELLTNYGKIDVLWFDCDGRSYPWDQERTYALVRRLQPDIVIDNRLDPGDAHSHIGPWADYYTPEQFVGGFNVQQPWESCMTISRSGQWSWGGAKDGVKTRAQCLNMLIQCAGGDGNLLLNVGPRPDGVIDPEQANRLKELGAWLARFGASIYGTRGGPFKPGKFGASTHKGQTVYLHIQRWPGDTLTLPAIPAKILRATALTGGNATFKLSGDAIEIALPVSDRQELDTIVALELDRPAREIEPRAPFMAAPSLATGKHATASNVFQDHAAYGADQAFDGDSATRWATDSGTKSAWLEIDLGQPATVGRACLEQAYPELKRVQKFAIEYWQGEQWKACYRGRDLGATLDATFAPVTAQRFRLNITEASDGPTFWEFQLYPPNKQEETK
ncbi:MAG: alpha-L-fucosidase [Kiritimatiellaeota bacterium]|nr:alpha-L-fucosidase [Kiritimatiellota bacterium]